MKNSLAFVAFFFSLLLANACFAYIGPGAGITAIGSAIAFIVVLILLFVGFLWYPIKKIMNRGKSEEAKSEEKEKDSDQARGL